MTLRTITFLLILAVEANGQTPPSPTRSTLTADVLRDLPNGASLFAVLETVHPEVIADGFHSVGLDAGAPAALAAFLASPRQTRYRVGDVDISNPVDGKPLLFPHLMPWERTDVTTALMPLDSNSTGLTIDLVPQQPGARWTGTLETSATRGFLITAPDAARPPPIDAIDQWAYGSVAVNGPAFQDRLRVAGGVTWLRNEKLSRGTERTDADLLSVFAQSLIDLPDTRWRTFFWLQNGDAPITATALHLQSTLERRSGDASTLRWRLFGGYTRRDESPSLTDGALSVDRLIDGPYASWLPASDRFARRASIGGRVAIPRTGDHHQIAVGASAEHNRSAEATGFSGLIAETIDGIPARIWDVHSPPADSVRSAATATAYIEDRITISPQVTLDAGVAFDWVHGRAAGASSEVQWFSLLPRAAVQWRLGTWYDLELITGYRRSANAIRMDLLAFGDPAAPTADVYRWTGGKIAPDAPLVARVGPGTGGDERFSSIDPGLDRPHVDEFVIGMSAQMSPSIRLSVSGLARRQSPLVQVVNVGVGPSDYEAFTIPDDNVDLIGTADDQQLTVYNRLPVSFGHDRFLVSNPDIGAATLGAVVIGAEAATNRLWMRIGATAFAAVGSGGARGFRVDENDQDVLGELLTTPNARTFARGRLFGDRAYVIKWSTIYRFPAEIRLGAIARYQDGQPFSRIVTVPGLNQGTEAIQAFPNGRSRFAFTGTLDLRLQKRFAVLGRQLDLVFDVYNALNMTKEVEEYVVTGDRFRTTTFVQPAPVMHLGFRLSL